MNYNDFTTVMIFTRDINGQEYVVTKDLDYNVYKVWYKKGACIAINSHDLHKLEEMGLEFKEVIHNHDIN